ncbi:GDP-L-fucose synthase family protein [Rhodopirellula halodulae]|uniref:GDP-L-fucose synthase family protein n=1 Tax=Rhodopirellula halodulae TaxID=2894198 RepID=UPI001E2D04E2|nr:GDP-L-fucose synthase [Rhodopirellula sp. JC737]MCC9656508.1 GDP-L-fucose synthase [Rhodopirellula sp. JC737]
MPQKIFVAGHRGMVGSAILRRFAERDDLQVIMRTRSELDLCNQAAVGGFFKAEQPDAVIFAAAKVGGIHANATYPANFAYDNVMMAANAIHAAYESGVQRFLFLGSTCIYPRMAPQPIEEDSLLTSPLEQTNEAYALAKIMGLKLCQYYRQQHGVLFHSAMPTNLYGPGDNYHPDNSHVIPGLIRRFDAAARENAESVTVWGSGKPRREFLHVDDLAAAVDHLLQLSDPPDWVNVGTGVDLTIAELAQKIAQATGFEGEIVQDASKPDGTPVKCTDISRIRGTGWQPTIQLDDGLTQTVADYRERSQSGAVRSV